MEPMNATVNLRSDRLDVWVGTQGADMALDVAASVSGLKPEQVFVHNAFLGGGFGRRDASDEIAQAIAIAKVVKRPVKLIWTREEDTRQDKFRPHAVVAFKAATGRITSFVSFKLPTFVSPPLISSIQACLETSYLICRTRSKMYQSGVSTKGSQPNF